MSDHTKKINLTQQASKGAFWALISNIMVSAISFVGTAILARMLTPKDFGLIGMAVLITGLVQLFGNFGLGAALIQKKDVVDEDLSTAFWANIAAGVALALICILISPLATLFFHENAVMWVLISLAFNFVLSAACSVHSTLLYKRLQMKPLAVIEVSGRILRVGVMLISAFCGLTFWSIVIGMITECVFNTFAKIILDPWRPSFVFSMQKFKEMFQFGRNILGGGFLWYLNRNMDFIVTGRVLGADLLGFYQMAYNLPFLVWGYIKDSIGTVSFPVFCKVQDDNDRLTRGFLKIVKFIALATFPVFAGLSLMAHDFIFVVYGEKWLPTVVPMQILCFGAALATINIALGPVLNAKGRPDLVLKWSGARLPVTIAAILIGVHFGAIVGVAWGMFIIEVLSFAIVFQVFQILNNDIKEYWKSLFPATAASIVMVCALITINLVFPMSQTSAWIRLGIKFIVGAIAYIAIIIFCFKNVFEDFKKFITSKQPIT